MYPQRKALLLFLVAFKLLHLLGPHGGKWQISPQLTEYSSRHRQSSPKPETRHSTASFEICVFFCSQEILFLVPSVNV